MLTVVTGAEGFLGRRLVARLAREGRSVLAVDMKAPLSPPPPGVQAHLSDLSDPATLIPPDCEPIGAFALVHLAWDMRSRETSFSVQSRQVTCLAGLLDYWQQRGLCYVIAPGSAQEYGGRSGLLSEGDPPLEPLSPYGWAKHAAYTMALSWSGRTSIGLLWLRPFIVYGPGQAGSMMVPYAVRQAHIREPATFSDGRQKRDFVYADDVVEAIWMGLTNQPPGATTLNLGSGEPVTIREVLEEIAAECDAGELFTYGGRSRRPGEPDVQAARIDRAREVLGWTPRIGWREGIRRTCREGQT